MNVMKHYDPKQVLQEAKTIAVLGVNQNEDSYANKIVRKIRQIHKIAYPVNPKYSELFGELVYESLEKCPSTPDLVVFVVNPSIGIDYLPIVKDLGLKHIWLQPGTFDVEFLEEAKSLGLSPIEACVLVVGNYL